MSYHASLQRLTDGVRADVLTAWQAWAAGRISRDQFVGVAAMHIGVAAARAVTLADLAFAMELSIATGSPQPATGIRPRDENERIRADLQQIGTGEDDADAVAVLAAAAALVSAQQAWSAAINGTDAVVAWSRRLNPGACELCQSLAAGDNRFPASVEMIHHKGCRCTPKPIIERTQA